MVVFFLVVQFVDWSTKKKRTQKDISVCYLNLGVERMAFRLLLVEDDREMREIITDYFIEKSDGIFVINSAETGEKARQKCLDHEYDLVLLDVMLPEIDGFIICQELRKISDVPVIFITVRHTVRMTGCMVINSGVMIM